MFRQALTSLLWNAGPLDALSYVVTQQSTPNMSVQVAGGQAWVTGTSVSNVSGQNFSTQGSYYGLNDASVTLTIATANATNPRIDLVYLQINDSFYSGATNNAALGVVTGTPAASPATPATPTNALALATVRVNANASSITNSNITPVSTGTTGSQATLAGTPIVCTSGTHPTGTRIGQIIWESDTGQVLINTSGGFKQYGSTSKPMFLGRCDATAQALASGAWTEINLQTEIVDSNTFHTGTAARVTVPWTGWWRLSGCITYAAVGASGASARAAAYLTNNTTYAPTQAGIFPTGTGPIIGATNLLTYQGTGSNLPVPLPSRRVFLNAGDHVSLGGYAAAATTVDAYASSDPGQVTFLEVAWDGAG